MIDIRTDAELIKTATGSEGKEIAYNFGKSPDWLVKQYNGEYPNFWLIAKHWVRSFGRVQWSKAEIFFNDFDLFRRNLWREVNGVSPPFPSEKERELLTIYNRLGLVLEF